MKRAALTLLCLSSLSSLPALSRGVSPYLPLKLEPEIERQIERVLILAGKPVLKRPFAAATVLDALPAACERDADLCRQVRAYLSRYMRTWSVTDASVEVAATSGADTPVPNSYGMTSGSEWATSVRGYWQPSDHALLSLGAVAYDNEVIPEGSMLSLGWDRAQLDIGYRARWLSPLSDSSMLSSTQAATMPSVTLSNYVPLTRFGFQYEAFVASMSRSDQIAYGDTLIEGRPRLAGVHLSMEPASGWALGLNRVLQYGGGDRPGSFSDLLHAFVSPSRYDNTNPSLPSDQQFGNQVASFTSSFLFPGRVPFSVYFEYAGEDTSHSSNYLLGNSALSAGIHFPLLGKRFDLTYEVSEWQNAWYVNNVYGDGLTNKGHVIGHWAGDDRVPGMAPGGQSHMLKLGYEPKFGGVAEVTLRTLNNEKYFGGDYRRAYDATLSYSRSYRHFIVGAEAYAGRNVFGDDFSRVAAFFRYNEPASAATSGMLLDSGAGVDKSAELFVDAGYSYARIKVEPDENVFFTDNSSGAHLGVGARRAVSDRSDLGVRLELDDVDGHTLASVRALDYRYRFAGPLALNVFLGASRYDLATPAFGMYFGAGLQWRNVMPGWDVGVDARRAEKVARDRLLPGEVQNPSRPDSFYTIDSVSLSISKRF